MIRKPRDLPPAIARAFVKDMEAYFAEKDRLKQDEIALRQLHALKEHQGPRALAARKRGSVTKKSLSTTHWRKMTARGRSWASQ